MTASALAQYTAHGIGNILEQWWSCSRRLGRKKTPCPAMSCGARVSSPCHSGYATHLVDETDLGVTSRDLPDAIRVSFRVFIIRNKNSLVGPSRKRVRCTPGAAGRSLSSGKLTSFSAASSILFRGRIRTTTRTFCDWAPITMLVRIGTQVGGELRLTFRCSCHDRFVDSLRKSQARN